MVAPSCYFLDRKTNPLTKLSPIQSGSDKRLSNRHLLSLVQEYESKYAHASTAEIHRYAVKIAVAVFASIFVTDFVVFVILIATLVSWTCGYLSWVWLIPVGFFLATRVRQLTDPKDEPSKPVRVKRRDYPQLFAVIDEVSATTQTRVNQVFIEPVYNAAAQKRLRCFGLFGTSNRLLLGLPFLMSISKQELRGLLGHELFHFSKYQAFDSIIRRALATSWNLSYMAVDVFKPWHAAKFNQLSALAVVLGKKNERLADQAAKNITSPFAEAVQALRCGVVHEHLIEKAKFTQPEFKLSAPSPPDNLMDLYRQEIGKAIQDQDSVLTLLYDIKNKIYSKFEIHPTWYERVKTLNFSPSDPQLMDPVLNYEPATELLGENLGEIEAAINRQWVKKVENEWKISYQYETDRKEDLVPEDQVTEFRDIMQHIHALHLSSGIKSTERWVNKALEIKPNDNLTNYMLAAIQLQQGKPEAEQKLLTMVTAAGVKVPGLAYEALSKHYESTGNVTGLEQLEAKYDLLREKNSKLHFALTPNPKAKFEPAELTHASLKSCRRHLKKFRCIKTVYAGRQVIRCCPDTEFIVFIVVVNYFSWVGDGFWKKLVDGISLGGSRFHCLPANQNKSILKQIKKTAGAKIYEKGTYETGY